MNRSMQTNWSRNLISLDMKGEMTRNLSSVVSHLVTNFEKRNDALGLDYIGAREDALLDAFILASACSFKSALSPLAARLPWTWRYFARLSAAISSASSICFLYDLILCSARCLHFGKCL